MRKLLFLFSLITLVSCVHPQKSTHEIKSLQLSNSVSAEDISSPVQEASSKQKLVIEEPKSISFLLNNAQQIQLLAYTIESGDFATKLFKQKLRGKTIEIMLSKKSQKNYRSKIRYLKSVDLRPVLINLPKRLEDKAMLILDNKNVIKNFYLALVQNDDVLVVPYPINLETNTWSFCKNNPNNCHLAFKEPAVKKQITQKKHSIPTKLPNQTKYQEFINNKQNQ